MLPFDCSEIQKEESGKTTRFKKWEYSRVTKFRYIQASCSTKNYDNDLTFNYEKFNSMIDFCLNSLLRSSLAFLFRRLRDLKMICQKKCWKLSPSHAFVDVSEKRHSQKHAEELYLWKTFSSSIFFTLKSHYKERIFFRFSYLLLNGVTQFFSELKRFWIDIWSVKTTFLFFDFSWKLSLVSFEVTAIVAR